MNVAKAMFIWLSVMFAAGVLLWIAIYTVAIVLDATEAQTDDAVARIGVGLAAVWIANRIAPDGQS